LIHNVAHGDGVGSQNTQFKLCNRWPSLNSGPGQGQILGTAALNYFREFRLTFIPVVFSLDT